MTIEPTEWPPTLWVLFFEIVLCYNGVMSDLSPRQIELPPPNPVTARRHRRQFRRQILLPVLLAVVILGGLAYLFWRSGIGSAARWAEISTIFLLLPLLLIGLVLLALVGGLIYAVGQALKFIPPYTRMAQQAIETIEDRVRVGMDVSARPVLVLREYIAMIERFVDLVTGKRTT